MSQNLNNIEENEPLLIKRMLNGYDRAGKGTQVRRHRKIGRNDQCPCMSGLKYKRCHGRLL